MKHISAHLFVNSSNSSVMNVSSTQYLNSVHNVHQLLAIDDRRPLQKDTITLSLNSYDKSFKIVNKAVFSSAKFAELKTALFGRLSSSSTSSFMRQTQ